MTRQLDARANALTSTNSLASKGDRLDTRNRILQGQNMPLALSEMVSEALQTNPSYRGIRIVVYELDAMIDLNTYQRFAIMAELFFSSLNPTNFVEIKAARSRVCSLFSISDNELSAYFELIDSSRFNPNLLAQRQESVKRSMIIADWIQTNPDIANSRTAATLPFAIPEELRAPQDTPQAHADRTHRILRALNPTDPRLLSVADNVARARFLYFEQLNPRLSERDLARILGVSMRIVEAWRAVVRRGANLESHHAVNYRKLSVLQAAIASLKKDGHAWDATDKEKLITSSALAAKINEFAAQESDIGLQAIEEGLENFEPRAISQYLSFLRVQKILDTPRKTHTLDVAAETERLMTEGKSLDEILTELQLTSDVSVTKVRAIFLKPRAQAFIEERIATTGKMPSPLEISHHLGLVRTRLTKRILTELGYPVEQ